MLQKKIDTSGSRYFQRVSSVAGFFYREFLSLVAAMSTSVGCLWLTVWVKKDQNHLSGID